LLRARTDRRGNGIKPHTSVLLDYATMFGKAMRLEEVGRLTLVGAALNHATGSSVTADYIQEKADALRPHHQQWEEHLRSLLELPSLAPKPRQPKKSAAALLKEMGDGPAMAQVLFEALKKKLRAIKGR